MADPFDPDGIELEESLKEGHVGGLGFRREGELVLYSGDGGGDGVDFSADFGAVAVEVSEGGAFGGVGSLGGEGVTAFALDVVEVA